MVSHVWRYQYEWISIAESRKGKCSSNCLEFLWQSGNCGLGHKRNVIAFDVYDIGYRLTKNCVAFEKPLECVRVGWFKYIPSKFNSDEFCRTYSPPPLRIQLRNRIERNLKPVRKMFKAESFFHEQHIRHIWKIITTNHCEPLNKVVYLNSVKMAKQFVSMISIWLTIVK